MGERVNLQSRRALLKQFAPQYREASSAQKRVLLDVFAQATGYHRRYGMCCSTMRRTFYMRLRTSARAILGQESNTRSSWHGMPPIGSAPNGSSPFSLPC